MPWGIVLKPALKQYHLTAEMLKQEVRDMEAQVLPLSLDHVAMLSSPWIEGHKDPSIEVNSASYNGALLAGLDRSTFHALHRRGSEILWQ